MPLQPVKLTGEQKKILFLPPKNPISIKGVAGCGKTTVALYRAKHLIDTYTDLFQEANVAIFTFNKALVKYMDTLLPVIPGGYQENSNDLLDVKPGMKINVTNFHKWAYHFLTERKIPLNTLDSNQIYPKVDEARKRYTAHRIAQKSVDFFMDEISWIKGRMICSEDEYIQIPRKGRGTVDRVTRVDRPIIWKIYQDYQSLMERCGYVDFDDYALLCLKQIDDNDRIFSHIIIDEAQDLSKAQLTVLSKLVFSSTQSITIIADAAQRIYKSAFSWAETGIELRGRNNVTLTKNYRNTAEIAEAAYDLLKNDADQADFTKGSLNTERHGPKPVWAHFIAKSDEFNFLIDEIKDIRKSVFSYSIAVLCRNSKDTNTIYNALRTHDIPSQFVKEDKIESFENEKVNICTMSSIKGLEFDYVFIVDLNDDIFPSRTGMDVEDNEDIQIITERRLLYVCMTRAKLGLFMCSSGQPSRFLHEIDSKKLEYKAPKQTPVANLDDDLPF